MISGLSRPLATRINSQLISPDKDNPELTSYIEGIADACTGRDKLVFLRIKVLLRQKRKLFQMLQKRVSPSLIFHQHNLRAKTITISVGFYERFEIEYRVSDPPALDISISEEDSYILPPPPYYKGVEDLDDTTQLYLREIALFKLKLPTNHNAADLQGIRSNNL